MSLYWTNEGQAVSKAPGRMDPGDLPSRAAVSESLKPAAEGTINKLAPPFLIFYSLEIVSG